METPQTSRDNRGFLRSTASMSLSIFIVLGTPVFTWLALSQANRSFLVGILDPDTVYAAKQLPSKEDEIKNLKAIQSTLLQRLADVSGAAANVAKRDSEIERLQKSEQRLLDELNEWNKRSHQASLSVDFDSSTGKYSDGGGYIIPSDAIAVPKYKDENGIMRPVNLFYVWSADKSERYCIIGNWRARELVHIGDSGNNTYKLIVGKDLSIAYEAEQKQPSPYSKFLGLNISLKSIDEVNIDSKSKRITCNFTIERIGFVK
ncbi:MAG: hypothetical protein AB7P02_17230 [Alphaproteobacteria bacterium]